MSTLSPSTEHTCGRPWLRSTVLADDYSSRVFTVQCICHRWYHLHTSHSNSEPERLVLIEDISKTMTEEEMLSHLQKSGYSIECGAVITPLIVPPGQMLIDHEQWQRKELARQRVEKRFLFWVAGGAVGWWLAVLELVGLIWR